MNSFFLIAICCLLAAYTVFSLIYYVVRLRPGRTIQSAATPDQLRPGLSLTAGPGTATEHGINPVLQQAADEWRYTFDAIADPVLILDLDLRVVKGNQAAIQLLSVDGLPIEGQHCYQLFAGSWQICPDCPVQKVFSEKKKYLQEISQRYLGRTFSVTCSPLFDGEHVVGYVSSPKDITRQRYLEKRLLHAHKLESVATLAGGIAHDFNNILGVILGNTDLLCYRIQNKGAPDALSRPECTFAEVGKHLQAIKQAGIRAKELVGQLLAFSCQSANQRIRLSIVPVIKESCRMFRSTLPETVTLKVTVPDEIGMIYADPSQLQQMMVHLCTNAAQSLEGMTGVIEVSLHEVENKTTRQLRYYDLVPGRYVALAVADTGVGMSSKTLERIFDPFFTTKEVGLGSGMGLAVLHGIIMAHDGVIDVASSEGKGSVFTVFFPCFSNSEDDEDNQQDDISFGTGTILFVDGEEDILTMRTRMLSLLGYRVLPTTSAEQALHILSRDEEQIDLLIADHAMPGMTGLQLAVRVHALQPDLPIILCSDHSEALLMEKNQQHVVRRFLAKSVGMRQLSSIIQEILRDEKKTVHENSCCVG
jgi:Signal transduction histidine kinase, nitrogen specific